MYFFSSAISSISFHKLFKMKYVKINKNYKLLFIIVLLAQCSSSEKMPITEATMSNILTDIHIAEASVDNESAEMKDSITRLYYPQIFERHGIQQWQFDSTMSMLSKNPVQMERIFKRILENIKKKNTPDSLNKKK
jgi:hypothetical protein